MCAWGKAKLEFRRHMNDLNGKHLREKVMAAMGDQAFTGTDKRTHDPPLPLSAPIAVCLNKEAAD